MHFLLALLVACCRRWAIRSPRCAAFLPAAWVMQPIPVAVAPMAPRAARQAGLATSWMETNVESVILGNSGRTRPNSLVRFLARRFRSWRRGAHESGSQTRL